MRDINGITSIAPYERSKASFAPEEKKAYSNMQLNVEWYENINLYLPTLFVPDVYGQ